MQKNISKFFYSSSAIVFYILCAVCVIYYVKLYIFDNKQTLSLSEYAKSFTKFIITGDIKDLDTIFNPPAPTPSSSFSYNKHSKKKKYLSLEENNTTVDSIDICKDLKIGGLDEEVKTIINKAFLTRNKKYREVCKDIAFNHVKGILLYGPPGTGKTLIARSLSEKVLKCDSLKIVNGPELLDKWIGSSEKNMRDLFVDAENGTEDELHVIIFDELDSICRKRSVGDDAGSRCQNNIVNTLLSKMDGYARLNNILIIGMTNNIDFIDKALLRPGRFEVQIKINLPSKSGRKDIFKIYIDTLQKHFILGCNYEDLSDITEGYSGADIEGLVRGVVTKKLLKSSNYNSEREENNNILKLKDFEEEIDTINKKKKIVETPAPWGV